MFEKDITDTSNKNYSLPSHIWFYEGNGAMICANCGKIVIYFSEISPICYPSEENLKRI